MHCAAAQSWYDISSCSTCVENTHKTENERRKQTEWVCVASLPSCASHDLRVEHTHAATCSGSANAVISGAEHSYSGSAAHII